MWDALIMVSNSVVYLCVAALLIVPVWLAKHYLPNHEVVWFRCRLKQALIMAVLATVLLIAIQLLAHSHHVETPTWRAVWLHLWESPTRTEVMLRLAGLGLLLICSLRSWEATLKSDGLLPHRVTAWLYLLVGGGLSAYSFTFSHEMPRVHQHAWQSAMLMFVAILLGGVLLVAMRVYYSKRCLLRAG